MTEKEQILKETYTVLVEKDGCHKCSRRRREWSSSWVAFAVVVTVITVVIVSVMFNYSKMHGLELRLADFERQIDEMKKVEANMGIREDYIDRSNFTTPNTRHLSNIFQFEEAVSDEDWGDDNEEGHDDHDEAESVDYPGSSRKKRQVDLTSRTQDGVEIHERGYGVSFNRTTGLRIYESLLFTGGNEPRDPSISWDTTDPPIQPHHRENSFWTERSMRKLEGPSFDPVFDQYSRSPTTQRPSSYPPSANRASREKQMSGSSASGIQPVAMALTPQAIQHDERYQPTTETPAALLYNKQHDQQGHLASTEAPTTPHKHYAEKQNPSADGRLVPHKRKRHPQKIIAAKLSSAPLLDGERTANSANEVLQEVMSEQIEPKAKLEKRKIMKKHLKNPKIRNYGPGAVHFVAYSMNTSNSVLENEGDISFRNDFGVYRNWRLSSRLVGSSKPHTLRHEGGVYTVRHRGLYLIYAQVYYLDIHKSNAYEVFVNTEPFLHCAVAKDESSVGQTCYTSGVTLLNEGDKIFVRDVEPLRTHVINPSKTFFGVVKLRGFKF